MGFKAGVEAGKCIDRILRETVKGSLRWPGTMAKYCEPLHSVHHPKEGPPDAYQARVSGWKQRIRAALG
ncbi:Tn7-like element transposition protein TnsE [Klebsiella variicola]|nr:Tn7-like element transposition protein TnsE [Klebsiella variicola]